MRKATFYSAFWEIAMNQNVRKITEGAMMVALVGVFMLIDRQFQGTFSSMFVFLLPLPMVYFGAKYGLRDSLMVLVAIIFVFSVTILSRTAAQSSLHKCPVSL